MISRILTFSVVLAFSTQSLNAQWWKDVLKTPTKTDKSETKKTETESNSSSKTSDIDKVLGGMGGILGGSSSSGMTNDLAAKGLKEALNVGTNAAASNLGRVDGFLANAAVKILFPPEARKVERTLRSLGMNAICDQFITSVNRAAESAVVEAKPIFVAAVRQMTISDAINILTGNKDAATQYLKRTSGQALMAKFEPIIQSNLQRTNATKYWSTVMNAYNNVPFVQKVNPNLPQYVTQKANDGIFFMVAKEELKIRENPTARVGSVLQDVFGWADKNGRK